MFIASFAPHHVTPAQGLSGNSPEILERRARRPRESAGLSEKNLAASKWSNPHADFVLAGLDRLDPAIHAFGGARNKRRGYADQVRARRIEIVSCVSSTRMISGRGIDNMATTYCGARTF